MRQIDVKPVIIANIETQDCCVPTLSGDLT